MMIVTRWVPPPHRTVAKQVHLTIYLPVEGCIQAMATLASSSQASDTVQRINLNINRSNQKWTILICHLQRHHRHHRFMLTICHRITVTNCIRHYSRRRCTATNQEIRISRREKNVFNQQSLIHLIHRQRLFPFVCLRVCVCVLHSLQPTTATINPNLIPTTISSSSTRLLLLLLLLVA